MKHPPPVADHAMARLRILAPVLAVWLAAGCASDGFRTSVSSFATATEAAATNQTALDEQRLARREAQIADDLARDRVALVLDGCAQIDFDSFDRDRCRVIRQDGQPLERPFVASNIVRLRTAFADYARTLSALAEGVGEGGEAFRTATGGLATAFGGLSGAVEAASGPNALEAADLDAVGKIIAELGVLYFEYQRVESLREIVIETDPTVQAAAGILTDADRLLAGATNDAQVTPLREAEEQVARLISKGAPEAALRAAQADLFRLVDDRRRNFRAGSPFRELGEAHARLAEAARTRSEEDILAAINLILAAARKIEASVTVLSGS